MWSASIQCFLIFPLSSGRGAEYAAIWKEKQKLSRVSCVSCSLESEWHILEIAMSVYVS